MFKKFLFLLKKEKLIMILNFCKDFIFLIYIYDVCFLYICMCLIVIKYVFNVCLELIMFKIGFFNRFCLKI